jgi:aminoglycoside phosphotransferase (APT) family kinase protein
MDITPSLVKSLIAEQFPQWADLPVTEVLPNGWDNRTFRLGDEMSVRLPSAERYIHQVQKEHDWLPKLAPHVSLPITTPIAIGEPGQGFPWQWAVNGWMEGETAATGHIADLPRFARSLAEFLKSLQHVDSANAPTPGPFKRGGDVGYYDDESRQSIKILETGSLGDGLDIEAIAAVWDAALESKWTKSPVWIHGDVSLGNMLVKNGELSAVIDFGGICVGDPACDLAIAWTAFEGESRDAFRSAIDLDDATWARGAGWTLWKALITYSGLSETNAIEAQSSRQTIERILADRA